MKGLIYTREYRSLTYWFRAAFRFLSKFTFDPLESLGVNFGLIKSRQKTLVWERKERDELERSQTRRPRPTPRHPTSPSIELTDYSTVPHDESVIQDTPAQAHSLFPPAITTRRPRNESDASITDPILPIYEQYRRSDDSQRPLVQRPSDVHRSRAGSSSRRVSGEAHYDVEGRRSSEVTDARSSSDYMLSPTSPDGLQGFGGWLGLDTTVQSRQGYRRANSDPGSPPIDLVAQAGASGLGIDLDDRTHSGGR